MMSNSRCRKYFDDQLLLNKIQLQELKSIARLFGVKLELPADYNEQASAMQIMQLVSATNHRRHGNHR